jgi:hypothetical protein
LASLEALPDRESLCKLFVGYCYIALCGPLCTLTVRGPGADALLLEGAAA